MSGAPVYLSGPFDHIDIDNVRPLCYEDGLLLRPLAPAAPLPGDLSHAMDEKRLCRVMAPLANHAAAFVLYNLHAIPNGETGSGVITPADYQAAVAMIQPYPGPWPIPDQGLLVYDHQTGKMPNAAGPQPNREYPANWSAPVGRSTNMCARRTHPTTSDSHPTA